MTSRASDRTGVLRSVSRGRWRYSARLEAVGLVVVAAVFVALELSELVAAVRFVGTAAALAVFVVAVAALLFPRARCRRLVVAALRAADAHARDRDRARECRRAERADMPRLARVRSTRVVGALGRGWDRLTMLESDRAAHAAAEHQAP